MVATCCAEEEEATARRNSESGTGSGKLIGDFRTLLGLNERDGLAAWAGVAYAIFPPRCSAQSPKPLFYQHFFSCSQNFRAQSHRPPVLTIHNARINFRDLS